MTRYSILWGCLAVGLLAAVDPAAGQSASRQRVSGPKAAVAATTNDEQIYTLLRRQLTALLEAQDAARAARGRFAAEFGTGPEALGFTPPAGVTVTFGHADALGWSMVATHAGLPGKSCVIWAGQVPPPRRPATSHDGNRGGEGEVVCDLVP